MWRSPFRQSVFDIEPFWRREPSWAAEPAVDIVEKDKAYEITAELPGMDEKNIEVKVVDGGLTIKGEKQEEKEEKKKDFYLHERHFGSFERSCPVPEGVDAEKIEANFKKGVLTVTLPKKLRLRSPQRKSKSSRRNDSAKTLNSQPAGLGFPPARPSGGLDHGR